MDIISLVNSAESLEKAIGLVHCAFVSNQAFYEQFDNVYVFYGNNLQKRKAQPISSSIYAFSELQRGLNCAHYTYNYIIETLLSKNYISPRNVSRLSIDNERYQQLVTL